MKKAIVSIIVGDQYRQFWQQYCERSWRAYADRHAYDIVIIDRPILPLEATRSIHWHKLLVLGVEAVKNYDRVVWLDADIQINFANAPSVVDQTPEDKIGVVLHGDLQDDLLKPIVWERWAQAFSELGHSLTALKQFWPEYYKRHGLEGDANIRFNTGVLVLTPSIHGEILSGVFHKYSRNAFDYEQTFLNFELARSSHYQIIDPRFNIQIGDEILKHYPFLFFLDHEAPTLLRNELFAFMAKLCLFTLYDNSYFFIFAARDGMHRYQQMRSVFFAIETFAPYPAVCLPAAGEPQSLLKADIEVKLLTKDEARRIAANIAKLPELVRKP